jgi:NadR type nicotinamide-nucleotide adenylyltransferase
VYASFVERVCLLGGESSGKTTQAAALAKAFSTAWVPEYGRRLWEEKGGKLAFEDELLIAERQVAAEEEAARSADRWLFCDGSPLTVLCYSLDLFGRADPRLAALARRPYRMTFLCAADFAFVQDGTRRDEAFRTRQHEWYLRELRRSGANYAVLEGTVADRTARAAADLARLV